MGCYVPALCGVSVDHHSQTQILMPLCQVRVAVVGEAGMAQGCCRTHRRLRASELRLIASSYDHTDSHEQAPIGNSITRHVSHPTVSSFPQ